LACVRLSNFCTYLSPSVYKAARAGPWSRGCAQATRTQDLIGPQAHADNPRIHEFPMTRCPHGEPTSKSVVSYRGEYTPDAAVSIPARRWVRVTRRTQP